MIIYFATTTIDEVIITYGANYLCSYYYFKNKIDVLRKFSETKKLFIDSGAFSAYNSGKEINIDEYIGFLHKLNPKIYAGLDDIKSPEKTQENMLIMESNGLFPVPTFHIGESSEILNQMIEKYSYIALGGMVMAENKHNWLRGVWAEILAVKPDMKVHGFGMTDQSHIRKYPWHSIDSTSFDRASRFGLVTLINPINKIYTIHVNKWRNEYFERTGDKRVYNNNKLLRNETVRIGIETFQIYQKYITELHKDKSLFDYLTAQQKLF